MTGPLSQLVMPSLGIAAVLLMIRVASAKRMRSAFSVEKEPV